MAMDYRTYLATYRLPPTAASALAWLKSGQAPIGTPIPVALQPQLGGATTLQADTPGVDWPLGVRGASDYELRQGLVTPGTNPEMFTPPVAASVPTAMPMPQNPFLPQLGLILQQVANLGATYNPQRQAAAAATAASLAGSGLVDFPAQGTGVPKVVQTPNGPQVEYDYTTVAKSTPSAFGGAPDITYGIVQGSDGRAYLQAYSGVAHAGASRGVFSGSQVEGQQVDARRALDLQRQQAYANLQQQQAGITGQEQERLASLQGSWADYLSKGASEVAQTVAGWSVPPSTPAQPATYVGPQPQSGPSPLTQLTGGQNTVTGAPGGTVKPQTATTVASGIGSVSRTLSRVAKRTSGVLTKSTQLTR